MMKRKREAWDSGFPSKSADLGFESVAGTYKADGKTLELRWDLSFSPYYVGFPLTLEYELRGGYSYLD
jgi:hypothetical protein